MRNKRGDGSVGRVPQRLEASPAWKAQPPHASEMALFHGCMPGCARYLDRRTGQRDTITCSTGNQGIAEFMLTFPENPLPYGCGSIGYNICRLVRSHPAGDDRTALTWACFCAWFDGTVCTLAADDFETYCLPGAGADCDYDEAWTRECVHP